MEILAVITARGGSKRIPKKNIKNFCGRPIISYSIEAAIQSGVFSEVMVSTDSHEIAEIALESGASVPFMRSARTSDDFATTSDVIMEVLDKYKEIGRNFKYICCIYPTAPFITPDKLRSAMEIMVENNSTVVMPVVRFSYPPQRCFVIDESKYMKYKYPEYMNSRSQDLEAWYHDAGQFYIYNTQKYLELNGSISDGIIPIEVSELEVQDIDNEDDWKIAELKYRLMSENMPNRIFIRVDGNEIIATGHVMRCLAIAEQLKRLGAEVIFVVADEKPADLIRERCFEVDVLDTCWSDLNVETDSFCSYLVRKKAKVVLLDSYYITKQYLSSLSSIVNVVYIDDLDKFIYPVYAIINYGTWKEGSEYQKKYSGYDTHLLCGNSYVPLREEFKSAKFQVSKNPSRVLITTGGTDQYNMAGNLLEAAMNDSETVNLEYHVIVGYFNKNKEMLSELSGRYSNIILHENVSDMSKWMKYCDIAISAAGTTTYELCACGIPSVCFEVAENQCGAEAWEKAGYMMFGGNAFKNINECVENCIKSLIYLKNNFEVRQQYSEKMRSFVDGHGAERIAKFVLEIS